ncbi:MAG: phosphatidylserine decarboxylase family protein [Muribaculaceae bacterium]|jgi:phosphatidylserine decarboxylase|nr:phosphatidylserine decarboxylase family protein [Muribaculaceae bacterium]MEE1337774.1 phosphatidylserine decarboxylase family protein [Muribaculaceae bacterium]
MRVKIHREGTNIIIMLLFILVIFNGLAFLFISYKMVPIVFATISGILFLFVVNFFRSPRRHFKGEKKNAVLASVDGTVVALEEVYEPEYLKRNVMQVSIFMTVFNVHANWVPVEGVVKYVTHHAGRYLNAYLPKSSTENERSTIVIETDGGHEVLVRQVAGAIARRIVTYPEQGERVYIDDQIGFIKFGSRVDIYLPLDSEIFAKLGDKTVGGITEIARLK